MSLTKTGMTPEAPLDFARSLRGEFEPGRYLESLTLLSADQRDGVLVVHFESESLRPGRYVAEIAVPRARGDDLWRAYTESDAIEDWTRWDIAVPLLEACETQAPSASYDADGSIRLRVP